MNKKFSIIFIYFIFHLITYQLSARPLGNDAVQIIESTNTHITIQVRIDSILTSEKIIDQKTYHLISLPGFHFTTEPGKPQLPSTGLMLAVPLTGGVNLQIVDSQISTRSNLTVVPAAEQILDETSQGEPPLVIDEKFYSQNIWYPQETVRIGETGLIRDQRVATVQICPMQYNPALKKLRIYKSLTFRLYFEGGVAPGVAETSSPAFEKVLQKMLPNYEAGKNWRQPKTRSLALQKTSLELSSSDSYKIYVKEDGLYRFYKNDLESAGILAGQIDPRTIKIFNRGRELPIYVRGQKDGSFDTGDYIEFYGQFNRGENSYLSPYSVSNVYWLVWGGNNGLRLAEVDGGLYVTDSNKFIVPQSHRLTRHLEEDLVFDRLLLVTDESADHWFWETMNANQSFQYKFTLHHPIPTESFASVAAKFCGSTHPSANPDHHVVIKINDNPVAEATWDGQTEKYFENREVSSQIFKDGENILTIELPGDTPAGEIDQVFFNWVEISYWRSFQAVDDFIEFQVAGNQGLRQFEISNFHSEDISIFDNLARRIVNFEKRRMEDSTYTVLFQDQSHVAPVTYYVFSSSAIKNAEKIVKDVSSDLRSLQNGADYILITHEKFLEAVQPLADLHSSRGLRVKIVEIQDIYDEFSFGIFDPRAIQRFLQNAYENWTRPAPLYVLLAGDATWGYDKQIAREWGTPCYIPSIMKYTISWGVTSSDNSFVCVSGDDRLPDMFIGRLPVNSVEETQIVVNKILQYEQHPEISDWRKRICLACGDGAFFEESADYLYQEYVPAGYDVPRLYTNPKSKYFGSTEEMVAIFNNGVSVLNFIGHGGGGVFFDAELFLLEDIVLLNNANKLPVIFSLTCFIGYFDNPWTPSMGEELFRADGKGVIATFGAAGRAWLYGDYYLNNALFQSLFTHRHRNLGQVTTEAKWQMIAWSGSYWDHVENYNLLGDPALRIGLPEQEVELQISNPSLKAGERLLVQGAIPGNVSGQVALTVFNSQDSLVTQSNSSVSLGHFQTQVQLPQVIIPGPGKLKAYFWNDNEDAIGTAPFSIDNPCFQQIFIDPAEPINRDPTYIITKVIFAPQIAPLGIDSVRCQWSLNNYSWNRITMNPQGNNLYKTQNPIIANEGSKVSYKFFVYYRSPNNLSPVVLESQVYSYLVKRRADLSIPSPGITIGGKEPVIIRITIKNNGETDAGRFCLEVFNGDPAAGGTLIADKTYINFLKAKTDTIVNISLRGSPQGTQLFYIRLDSENSIDETNEYNNVFSKKIQLLTIKDGSGGTVTTIDKNVFVTIPSQAVTLNTSFDIKRKSREEIASNCPIPAVFSLATLADGSQGFYLLSLDNSNAEIIKPFSVSIFASNSNPENLPKIYCWDEKNNQWSYRISHIDSSKMRIYGVAQSADYLFGLFLVDDKVPPKVAIGVEDQTFTNGDYVSSQPTISAVLEDESGIDMQSNPPSVKLNDRPISLSDLVCTPVPNSQNTVLLKYSPTLSPGEYDLKIGATDIAGNVGQGTLRLKITGEFELQAIANHPNPFVDETIIAYTLTDEAREVKIKIYTASGRLIRAFDFINEVGYVEHSWDGRDEIGDEVANGVYYLKFVAVNGNKRIERVEKVAKLK